MPRASTNSNRLRNSVALGVSVPADDGNIYLFRPSNPPAVFVISPTGEVLRRLSIPAPSEEFEPWDLKVSGGRILVFFQEKLKSGVNPRQLFTVVDSATGERLFHYAAPPEIGSGLACYTPDGFTFVNGEGRQLVLLHVTTK